MVSYEYKLYKSNKTKHLDKMFSEACFVWNHALALQKRYYKIFGKYIPESRMQKHFEKRIKRNLLHSDTTIEILQRLDAAYSRFFKHISKRPPKFKKDDSFSSIVFKRHGGYSLNGNVFTVYKIEKQFKFWLSRDYNGKIKRLVVKRNRIGEFYIIIIIDKPKTFIGKTHDGASIGIDFGLKTYMTLSDGTKINNPQFLKNELQKLRTKSHNLSKSNKVSKNRMRKNIELARVYKGISNKRNDFQWKLAHELCCKYDKIFIEDLNLSGMCRKWGRKMADLAHAEFVSKLEHVAWKYGVVVHKINRFYPSSKTCICGYANKELKLSDRKWTCPECGAIHDRDILAANNILRRGIYELESDSKTLVIKPYRHSRLNPTISNESMPRKQKISLIK